MIRELRKEDLEQIAEIWLKANVKVHDFIKKEYWENNLETVKSMFLEAEIYVYEELDKILGFIGLSNDYIEGLFITEKMRSKGIGKKLLDFVKQNNLELRLKVYEKNERAIKFYQREGFVVLEKSVDIDTGEKEFTMEWKKYENKLNKVMQIMEKIKYGWLDTNNNLHIGDMMQIENSYRVSSPEEVLHNNYGICFDQVEVERKLFKEKKNLQSYAIYTNHMIHTFITFEEENKYVYFEHSSPKLKGIYFFEDKKTLLKFVVNGFMNNHKIKDISKVFLIKYNKLEKFTTFQEIRKILLESDKILL